MKLFPNFTLSYNMKALFSIHILTLFLFTGCSERNNSFFHEQKLPSGKIIKVTSFNLVWGNEHGERFPQNDCFALEFVFSNPNGDEKYNAKEAQEVFELIRPITEQWGFNSASVSGFNTVKREGTFIIYTFNRNSNNIWSIKSYKSSVHSRK